MRAYRGVAVAASLVALIACAQSRPNDTAADVAALKALQDRELAVIASANIDTIMSIYTSDLVMMAPDEPMVSGADAVRKWISTMLAENTMAGKYTSANVDVSGDLGVVRYTGELTVTPKKGGAPMTEHIQGIHVMKRQADGSWKIAQDVWNSDSPPPPTPATPATPGSKKR